jgi:uncharacterized repeat protein (TIGR03806 family)
MKNNFYLLLSASIILFFSVLACSSGNEEYVVIPEPQSPVVMDLTQVPYPKLSDYKFFEGDMKNQTPSYGVVPYKPASGLFTDYAQKKRFVWMPKGTKASYDGDGKVLVLPVGAALVKTFYYNKVQPSNTTRIIETRVMIRKSTGWIFAEYVWNQDQTEATLQMNGSTTNVSWLDDNNILKTTDFIIPSEDECFKCHNISQQIVPIGIKPQNININYNYPEGSKNQLTKLIEMGYLENNLPANIVSIVDYVDTSKSLDLRVRSYLDTNCAHCHQDGGFAQFYVMRFPFNKTTVPANLGICMTPNHDMPDITGSIVKPGDVNRSILHHRLNTNDSYFRMPMLGRTIKHEEGIELVDQWINSLTGCD